MSARDGAEAGGGVVPWDKYAVSQASDMVTELQ